MGLIEQLKELTVGEAVGYVLLIATTISAIVEKTSKTVKPLTKLAQAIGRALNRELIEKVDKLERDFKSAERRREERDIKDARARVLRFGDELIHDVRHTKEHFDDILLDITEYEKYCDTHPDFENDRMTITAQIIKETYHNCMIKRTFLEP